jgi:hypothetical protein
LSRIGIPQGGNAALVGPQRTVQVEEKLPNEKMRITSLVWFLKAWSGRLKISVGAFNQSRFPTRRRAIQATL